MASTTSRSRCSWCCRHFRLVDRDGRGRVASAVDACRLTKTFVAAQSPKNLFLGGTNACRDATNELACAGGRRARAALRTGLRRDPRRALRQGQGRKVARDLCRRAGVELRAAGTGIRAQVSGTDGVHRRRLQQRAESKDRAAVQGPQAGSRHGAVSDRAGLRALETAGEDARFQTGGLRRHRQVVQGSRRGVHCLVCGPAVICLQHPTAQTGDGPEIGARFPQARISRQDDRLLSA